jgi:hypothetical protein
LNEVANLVLLLQALADRERTYSHTEADRNELFAIWRESINHVRLAFDYPIEHSLTEQETKIVERFCSSGTAFEFSNAPINEKNAKFHEIGGSRLNKLVIGLRRLEAFSTTNYLPEPEEVQAMLDVLEKEYDATVYEYAPKKLITDYAKTLTPVSYSVLSLNVHNISGSKSFAPANLIDDVWPALTDRGSLPDVLMFNEVSKINPGYDAFVEALSDAGYRVFTDPRSNEDHYNECLIGVGSRLILPTTKVEVLHPSQPSGLDYLALKFNYLETPVVLLSYRLHAFLDDETQAAIKAGKRNSCIENYRSIGETALPELQALVASFGDALILAGGDNNHGATRDTYEDLAQKPASLQRQASVLSSLEFHTPESGVSNLKQHTQIDHLLTSASVQTNDVKYEVLSSSKLDHAAITGNVEFHL